MLRRPCEGCQEGARHHANSQRYASTLQADGVALKTVSELLGHSSVSITADVYGT